MKESTGGPSTMRPLEKQTDADTTWNLAMTRCRYVIHSLFVFLDPEGGSQKATLVVVLVVVVISSLRVQKSIRLS